MEQPPTLPNITTSMKSRYPSGQQDWENYRAEIEDLYRRGGLENVRQYMEQRYNFKATIKQWKTQFKKWNLKKRTEGDEYKAILKKKRKREKERPGVASEFFLRDKVVPPGKIARYEEESRKRGTINATDTLSDISTPPGLSCQTPENSNRSPSLNCIADKDLVRRSISPLNTIDGPAIHTYNPVTFDCLASCKISPVKVIDTELAFQTPPLRPFDWFDSFVNSRQSSPPTIPNGRLSNSLWEVLAPLSQRISNYADDIVFQRLKSHTELSIQCPACRVISLIFVVVQVVDIRDMRRTETFIGAAVQCIVECSRLSDEAFVHAATYAGAILCRAGRYREAISILTRVIKSREELGRVDCMYLSAVVELAVCFSQLRQFKDAARNLRKLFGPRFRRTLLISVNPRGDPLCSDCTYKALPSTQARLIATSSISLVRSIVSKVIVFRFPASIFHFENEIELLEDDTGSYSYLDRAIPGPYLPLSDWFNFEGTGGDPHGTNGSYCSEDTGLWIIVEGEAKIRITQV